MSDDAPKPPTEPYVSKIDRRTALTWVGIVGAATAAAAGVVVYGPKFGGKPVAKVPGTFHATAEGYGTDPKLNPPIKAPWPRIMSDTQLQITALVVDHILPASGNAPSASSLGVPDFLNEWVSAPYPDQLKDRPIILGGLDELGSGFLTADAATRTAKLAALPGGDFFKRMRALTVGAYYTTEPGFKDIGYIGNESRASDPGPSPEVKAHVERELKKLGL